MNQSFLLSPTVFAAQAANSGKTEGNVMRRVLRRPRFCGDEHCEIASN
jgi:hypothetical protein